MSFDTSDRFTTKITFCETIKARVLSLLTTNCEMFMFKKLTSSGAEGF